MLRRLWQNWHRQRLVEWVRNCPASTLSIQRSGFNWTLEPRSCITEDIVTTAVFEPKTTERVLSLVKPGMTVIDVGANVGYFTLLMARAVTSSGRLIAFEPTEHYRALCKQNIIRNDFGNIVELRSEALSDATTIVPIAIGSASATLHWSSPEKNPREYEQIQTRPLDELAAELQLSRLDLIKVDIDGHEPAFLRGATNTIRRFLPIIVIEFAQHCLYSAGSSALELRNQLHDLGYSLLSEKTMEVFPSELSFLMECGNYSLSANAIAVPHQNCQGN